MSEWWTYRPSDLLMFSPRIYWRLFESINMAWWPLQLAIVGSVLAWLARGAAWWRASAWVLAAWFTLAGTAFLHQRLAPIHWVASAYAWAFGAQAVLLLALATGRAEDPPGGHAGRARGAGRERMAWALGLWSVLGQPLLTPLADRPWWQAELPGLSPDATALLALAWLLRQPPQYGWRQRLQRAVWVVPVAWCAISAATLATMGEWQALVLVLAALLAGTATRWPRA